MKKLIYIILLTNFLNAEYLRDNNKNVVLDSSTNLMWEDSSQSKTNTKSWSDAIAYCENLTFAGYSDWFLPNYTELLSIVEPQNQPPISSAFQNFTADKHWSSTTRASDTSIGLGIDFNHGHTHDIYGKGATIYVTCARNMQ